VAGLDIFSLYSLDIKQETGGNSSDPDWWNFDSFATDDQVPGCHPGHYTQKKIVINMPLLKCQCDTIECQKTFDTKNIKLTPI